ncbi:MAG: molecular chaperone Hsp20 [Planctomycetota bacterium]|jgi:HSP20 family protein
MTTYRAGFALPLEELRDELDRLWTSLTAAPPLHGWGVRSDGVFPAVNVRESGEAITVEAELPGLDAGDVEISVTGEELVLKGSRPAVEHSPAGDRPDANGQTQPEAKLTWHRRERGTGAFERRIPLPVTVDAAGVEARLVNGVLTVTCPKAPEAQPRRIEVRSA